MRFPVARFDSKKPALAPVGQPPIPKFDDDDLYRANLAKWLSGDEIERSAGRQYFWNAFMGSSAVEEIAEPHGMGGGGRLHTFRTAHVFFVDVLKHCRPEELEGILNLLLNCRGGYPYALAEVVLRSYDASIPRRDALVAYMLGEIVHLPHCKAKEFLLEHAQETIEWNLHFLSIVALFKIFVRSEAPSRINSKALGPAHALNMSFKQDIEPLLSGLPDMRKLACLIACASQFCSQGLAFGASALAEDHVEMQSQIRGLCRRVLTAENYDPVTHVFDNLFVGHEYIGVSLLVAERLSMVGMEIMADDLLTAACNGLTVKAPHDYASRHLVGCFLRKGLIAQAFELADDMAARNPDNLEYQLLAAQVCRMTTAGAERVGERVREIRSRYKLTPEQANLLVALEAPDGEAAA